MFLRGIFHMATRGTFTSCQRRLHICWCANVLLLLVKEVFFPLWGGMRAIPTSTFAVFWRKANVKRALASVPPVTWKRVKELTTAHQKWRAAVPREIWREKEAPKLRPSPRELFKKEVLWPTRQMLAAEHGKTSSRSTPLRSPQKPSLGEAFKGGHDSSWEQHKGSRVYKAAEAGGLILPWHVHQPNPMSSFHMGHARLLLDNVKRQMLGSSDTFGKPRTISPSARKRTPRSASK